MLSNEEKEYECHCKNNQNDAAVRRLINRTRQKAKRPILADKSPTYEKTLLTMQFNEEKEYDCNGKNNQSDATVRRLINAGTLGVRF